MARAKSWALRCVHEAQMHEENSFVTLTYNDEHLPKDGDLRCRDFQLFAKRLRKKKKFRYFQAGEYGDDNLRPHFHALLFGVDFSDDRYFWKNRRGHLVFRSPTLEEAWKNGFCEIGSLTVESAAYVARYCIKKASDPKSEDPDVRFEQEKKFSRYERVDGSTGEVSYVRPEFVTMSRDPAIGVSWLRKFKSDVFPGDEVIHEGRRYLPPRRYLDELSDDQVEEIKARRRLKVGLHAADLTADRLRVRERVLNSKVDRLLRDL